MHTHMHFHLNTHTLKLPMERVCSLSDNHGWGSIEFPTLFDVVATMYYTVYKNNSESPVKLVTLVYDCWAMSADTMCYRNIKITSTQLSPVQYLTLPLEISCAMPG